MHFYESHDECVIYTSEEFEERYLEICETCGDSDNYIGYFDKSQREEFIDLGFRMYCYNMKYLIDTWEEVWNNDKSI